MIKARNTAGRADRHDPKGKALEAAWRCCALLVWNDHTASHAPCPAASRALRRRAKALLEALSCGGDCIAPGKRTAADKSAAHPSHHQRRLVQQRRLLAQRQYVCFPI